MKKAEEWDATHAGMSSLEFIEAIQLDAMKEGAHRMARLPCWSNGRFIQAQDILTAAEQLTEKDL